MKKIENKTTEDRLRTVEIKLNFIIGLLLGLGVLNAKEYLTLFSKPVLSYLTNLFNYF